MYYVLLPCIFENKCYDFIVKISIMLHGFELVGGGKWGQDVERPLLQDERFLLCNPLRKVNLPRQLKKPLRRREPSFFWHETFKEAQKPPSTLPREIQNLVTMLFLDQALCLPASSHPITFRYFASASTCNIRYFSPAGQFCLFATWMSCSVHILRCIRRSYITYNCQKRFVIHEH